ncbi:hypothetical protein FIBSPDRAFT_915075 [Athelia psychrophila]|uniref:Uncharacterized protein n=1 Tax=Athelia psychrophila TaxID=1759441 RepID=A0A167V0T8_9AGAM|nr:hypothetical protein FIBSPDRAFT_915075 [Fibularhizoctonia sp. CBS 109695]
MAGHLAMHGDRFSMVKAARSNLAKQSKYLYYPMDATEPSNKYNPGCPIYNLGEIPYQKEQEYWATVTALSQAETKARRAAIVTQTGVSRMPLCVAGDAFVHPNYFPLDPFHLIYENCMVFIWDIWTVLSTPDEKFHMSSERAALFGQMVVDAMATLPPSFCGPIRDPHLKRNSQYKIYEWMALLHWYTIPFAFELGFDMTVLGNFATFVEVASRTTAEIAKIFDLFANFLDGDPRKISRSRLCLFQLVHVAQHIHWNAPCERAIGEKAPFVHLANIIHEREMMKILVLRVPALREETNVKISLQRPFSKSKILKRDQKPGTEFMKHFGAIQSFLRARASKTKLSSYLSEFKGDIPARSSRYFEALIDGSTHFGEALAFYSMALQDGSKEDFVVYHPIVGLRKWSATLKVACVPSILAVVGIWTGLKSQNVHILRKHPGLDLLSEAECGLDEVNADSFGGASAA